MKIIPRKFNASTVALLAALALAGCAAPQPQGRQASTQSGISEAEHQAHHPEGATTQPSTPASPANAARQGGMMGGVGGMMGGQRGMMAQGGQMDMKSMCEMHQRMRNSRTPQERAAMMNETMGNMTPEMRQRHLDMMEQQCK